MFKIIHFASKLEKLETEITTYIYFYKVYMLKVSLFKSSVVQTLKNQNVAIELASFLTWKTRNLQTDPWRCIQLKNFYEAIKFIVVVARFILGMMSRTKDNSSLLDAQLQTTKMCVSRHHDWQNLVLVLSNLKIDQQKSTCSPDHHYPKA